MSDAETDLVVRIARLEGKVRVMIVIAIVSLATAIGGIVAAVQTRAFSPSIAKSSDSIVDVLRVRELNVVDKNGVTRVKLASPLPAPVIAGRQKKTRGAGSNVTLSGMLLFDADGAERSGYATVDQGYSNVLLTLDDKRSGQHALFITEPNGGTTLRLFNSDTQDRVDVAVDDDGPSISMMRRGKEIFRQPAKSRGATSEKILPD